MEEDTVTCASCGNEVEKNFTLSHLKHYYCLQPKCKNKYISLKRDTLKDGEELCSVCLLPTKKKTALIFNNEVFCHSIDRNTGEKPCEDAYIAKAFPYAVDCMVVCEMIKAELDENDAWGSGLRSVEILCTSPPEKKRFLQVRRAMELITVQISKNLSADYRLSSKNILTHLHKFHRSLGPMAKAARKFQIFQLKKKLLDPSFSAWNVVRTYVQSKKDLVKEEIDVSEIVSTSSSPHGKKRDADDIEQQECLENKKMCFSTDEQAATVQNLMPVENQKLDPVEEEHVEKQV